MYIFLLPLLAVALISTPVIYRIKNHGTAAQCKSAMLTNICLFFGIMILAVILPLGGFVSAEVTAEAAAEVSGAISSAGLGYIAAALAVGLGSIGCGIAVGKAAPAAIGAIAEDPDSFGKAMIFVALGEGVALYGFLIAFLIIQAV
ncbi:MAG: ATPase [Oscillospiraceae bacterium]|nr:ATPase [Oscillospiraceae bacterium]